MVTAGGNNHKIHFVPHDLRAENRAQQIKQIKAKITAQYKDRIRAAATRVEKKKLKKERDASIAREIDPLLHDRSVDTPDCL